MTVLFLLKYLSDTAYYMIFAGFVGGALSLPDPMYRQMLLLCGCAAACRLIAGRNPDSALRFLPLPVLPALLLLPGGYKAAALLLPPILYLVYLLYKKQYVPDHNDLADSFLLLCKILPIPVMFTLLLGGTAIFTVFSFPYLVIYLFVTVYLLRILRHDEAVLRRWSFRLLNVLELCLVVALAMVLFSDTVRAALSGALSALYHRVVAPLLILVSYIFVGFGWIFMKLRSLLSGENPVTPAELQAEEDKVKNLIELEEGAPSDSLFKILLALGIVLAAVLVFLLFRRLASNRRRRAVPTGTETREQVDVPRPSSQRGMRLFGSSPSLKVRHWYRKYLLLSRSRGAGLTIYQNSHQQLKESERRFSGHDASLSRLRALYLPARYSERADHAAAAEAKKIYLSLKKNDE